MTTRLLSMFVFVMISYSVIGQHPSCLKVQTGKFQITTPESGTTSIKRTRDEQIERNKELGYEVIFSVTWTDECTYELRPKKLLKGEPSIMGDGTHVVYNTITEVTATHYTVVASSNFFEGSVAFVVERK